jgi:hypothetical protein
LEIRDQGSGKKEKEKGENRVQGLVEGGKTFGSLRLKVRGWRQR